MQIFQFTSLNLPRSFLRSDVFIKKHEFLCIKFRGPALSQLLVYLISRSFQNIAKLESAWVFVCAYLYVCTNVTSQNNVIVAAGKTLHRVLFLEMWQNFKFLNWKFKKFITYTRRNIYLLKILLHFLVD